MLILKETRCRVFKTEIKRAEYNNVVDFSQRFHLFPSTYWMLNPVEVPPPECPSRMIIVEEQKNKMTKRGGNVLCGRRSCCCCLILHLGSLLEENCLKVERPEQQITQDSYWSSVIFSIQRPLLMSSITEEPSSGGILEENGPPQRLLEHWLLEVEEFI